MKHEDLTRRIIDAADLTHPEHGIATRVDGSTLHELRALLKAKEPGFGGLF